MTPEPKHSKLWFFKLMALSRLSHLKLAVVIAAILLLLMVLTDLFTQDPKTGALIYFNAIGPALFVSIWIPTAFSLVVHVLSLSESYLDELRPILNCSDEVFKQLKTDVTHEKKPFLLLWGGLGLMVAILLKKQDLVLLLTTDEKLPAFYYLINLLTLLLWGLMFQVFNALTRNARLFGQIIRDHLEINLLDLKRLSPCSKIAIVPVLLAVGLYVVFPLTWVGRPVDFADLTFPILFTVPSLLVMFLMPLLPLKKKIQQQKEQQIKLITQAIVGDKAALKDSYLHQQNPNVTLMEMIQFRQYIEKLNDWGIDAPALKKVSLYVLLPPMTWVAAALVEQLVTG